MTNNILQKKQGLRKQWFLPFFFILFIFAFTKGNAQVANCGLGTSGNLLVNPSFELPAFTAAQNNIINWPLQGWEGAGGRPNIVKTNNSFSGGGPLNSQSGTQYLDIAGSSADFWQTFEFSCYAQVYFSGYFSVRNNTASTGRIDIYKVGTSNSLTLIASSNQLNMPNTMNIWYLSSGSAIISPGTYRFQISMGDYSNFDDACFSYTPTTCFNTNTETGSAPSTGCRAIANVRANDSINNILASSANSTISESGIWPTGISLNTTTGAVNVAAGTTPGKYFVTYNLCDLSSPTPFCKTQMDTVLVTSPVSTPVTVCSNTLPYTWNGTAYNTAGTYIKTLTNAIGCDSVVTLVLTVKASSTSSTPVSVCSTAMPYTWNGTVYNAAGTYTKTFTNAVGCDSIATLVLSIKSTSTSSTPLSVCSTALPYTWNGTAYNAAGTYSKTLTNAAGCDSIATLVLTVKSTSTSSTPLSVCSTALPYTWNGTAYNAAGTYNKTLTNAVGCDSVATLVLTVKSTSTSTTNASICPGDTYTFNGTAYNAAGTYTKTLTNAEGCDSIATLVLTLKATSTSTTNVSICPGDTYTFNGTVYNAVGTYTKTLTNAAGCDSIATLIISRSTNCVAPPCNMTAVIGVNSLIQCVTNNSYQFTSTVTGGTGPYTYYWDLNDGTYATTKDVTHTYATHGEHDVTVIVRDAYGCEAHASTVQIYIGAKPAGSFAMYPNSGTGSGITFNSTSTIGNGWMTYQWNLGNGTTSTLSNPGPIYYAPGTYTVTMIVTGNVANGTACSDTVTKTINVDGNGNICIAPTTSFTASATSACLAGNSFSFSNTSSNATSYSWNFGDGSAIQTTASASRSYVAAGTYTVTLTGTNSCGSSSATQTIVINNIPAAPAAITGAGTVAAGSTITLASTTTGGVWSSSNSAVATVNPSTGVVTGVAAGSATISYTVSNACGNNNATKAIIVTGTVPPPCTAPVAIFSINTASQCLSGNAFTFINSSTGTTPTYTWSYGDGSATATTNNGSYSYAAAGTYTVTLTATNACGTNSTTQTVTVKAASASSTSVTVCSSALPYTWNGTAYNAAGTYTRTLTNAAGCDSIATLILTVNSAPAQPAAISGSVGIVVGNSTTLSSATAGGVWSSSNNAVATVNPSTGVVTGVAAGTVTITYTVSNSCGSASRTQTILVSAACGAATTSTTNATICQGTGYSFNGGYYTVAGSYVAYLRNSVGCDSVATLVLTVNPLPAQPTAITGTTSVLVAGTTTLSSTPAGGVWSSGNTGVATVNPTTGVVTGVANGSVYITYTVTNGCGSRSVGTTVTVGTPVVVVPPTPVCNINAGFTINNATQCVTGNSFVYTSNVTGGVAPYTYAWNFHDGSVAATANPTKVYATYGEGNVQLQVTDSRGCTATATPVRQVVGAIPTASFSVIDNTGSGSSKTFISSSTIPAGSMSYAWNFGNGQTSTLINPTVVFVPGNYTVTLVVTGNGGCTATATQSITQTIINSVSVYPNPVMDAIQVSFRAASATPTTVKIMDLAGRVLQVQTVMPMTTGATVTATLDTRGLQSGSYIVHISDVQNGFLATKSILKQ